MKFSNILAFAGLACAAVPKPQAVVRDTNVIDTVDGIVATLDEVTTESLGAITGAVGEITGSVGDIAADLIATISDNYVVIGGALGQATAEILLVLDGAVDDIATGVSELTQAQIDLLVKVVDSVKSIIAGIEVTLELALKDLPAAVIDTLAAELKALESAIAPFVEPLVEFVGDILDIAGTLKLTVTGLQNALHELGNILQGLLDFLGLGAIGHVIDIILG